MLRLGLDDTDSLTGGCTTHLGARLLETLVHDIGYDLIGWPRLVRLNPNVPWKTRGNGAIALQLGKGVGPSFQVGELAGEPIVAYPGAARSPSDPATMAQQALPIIETWAHTGTKNTNPGLVVTDRPLPARFYWQRVRTVVDRKANRELLCEHGIEHREWGNGRGLVGAVGALAGAAGWVSHELLAYREPGRWGSERTLGLRGLERLEFEPGTFDSYNPHTGKVVVAPRGPDPVLYGLRGLYPSMLVKAMEGLAGEPVADWLIWATNQGSDDHLVHADSAAVGPRSGHRVRGKVAGQPHKGPGGHLFFQITDAKGTLDCAAFEPGKPLPEHLARLRPGDDVEVCGGTHGEPLTLAIEKLRFIYPSSRGIKMANPRCRECGKSMKSLGADAGYRCRPCGTWAPEEAASYVVPEGSLAPGWYEPPPGQRRHLARPKVLMECGDWPWERLGWSPPEDAKPKHNINIIKPTSIRNYI